jgi:hypothetical protein
LLFLLPIFYYLIIEPNSLVLSKKASLSIIFLLFPLTLFLKKELFDLTINMNKVYRDIENYNTHWIYASKTIESKSALSKKIKSLIWFNSPLFFDAYLGLPIGSSQYRDSKDWYRGTLENDLTSLESKFPDKTGAIQQMKHKILQTKELISDNYFYAYYEHAFIGDYKDQVAELQGIEAATKLALEHLDIHTYGHISGSAKKVMLIFPAII